MVSGSLRWMVAAALLALPALANSSGGVGGLTGAPGHDTCAACHGTGSVNPAGGKLTVAVVGGSNYVPGQPLRLRVTLEDSTARRWGFQVTARRGSANTQSLGTFTSVSSQTFTSGASTLIGQNSSGTNNGTTTSASWEVQWNPPAANEGSVIFYASGNAANGNGSSDNGDKVFTTTLEVSPQTTTDVSGNRAMPQFVFGTNSSNIGFASTISFSNTRDEAASVKVSFFGDDGSPVSVGGSTSRTIDLAGKATALVRADEVGPFTQAWALIDLPDGVASSGVFRQKVPGRIDQEAAVLLSKSNATEARFSFDETGSLTTVMALLNPATGSATVTIRVFNEAGALVAPAIQRTVDGRKKLTLILPSEVAAAEGKRGMVELQTSGGAISVLALRFDDSGAFTAVPVSE